MVDCLALDNIGDDFESGKTDTFTLSVPAIAVGDFQEFSILNSGGGFLELSWDLAGLKLEAILESGTHHLMYDQPDVDTNLKKGESYHADQCEW